MLLLTSSSDLVRVTAGTGGSLLVHASWDDNDAGTITLGHTNTAAITGTSVTTVVGSPSGTNKRNVKFLSVRNDHASVTSTVTIDHTDGANAEVLWKGSLLPGEQVVLDNSGLWTIYASSGIAKGPSLTGPPDVQVFTASGPGTWTKPTSFIPKIVQVILWAGGGGGGAGASLASASVANGGSGGGGGAFNQRVFRASDLGATENLNVGSSGAAGSPGAGGAAGGDGGTGGNSTFGTTVRLSAYGGGGGRGGDTSAVNGGGGGGGGTASAGGVGAQSTAGLPGGPPIHGTAASGTNNSSGGEGAIGTIAAPSGISNCAEFGGGGGGGGSQNAAPGGSSLRGGGGGGIGGGHTSSPFTAAAGSGGSSNSYTPGGGGTAGISSNVGPATRGQAGPSGDSTRGGAGGGGGGTTVSPGLAGAVGGEGGVGGGGGGGGGCGMNPGLGGAGGAGGLGVIYVFSW